MQSIYDDLIKKYNYDSKTIKALKRIIPALISYYGREYEDLINNAVLSTKIEICSSYDTVSSILGKYNYNKIDYQNTYYSVPTIIYNENLNRFEISNINRFIILENKYNLDSPKGIEVLTSSFVSLIKSYVDEYTIEGNILIKTEGLRKEKYKIIYDRINLETEFLEEENLGLQKSLNMFDTSRITSNIVKDDYKIHEYSFLQIIGTILKEKFGYSFEIKEEELLHKPIFTKRKDFDNLSFSSDKCLFLEDEMLEEISSKEKKETLKNKLKRHMQTDVSSALIDIRKNDFIVR